MDGASPSDFIDSSLRRRAASQRAAGNEVVEQVVNKLVGVGGSDAVFVQKAVHQLLRGEKARAAVIVCRDDDFVANPARHWVAIPLEIRGQVVVRLIGDPLDFSRVPFVCDREEA